MYGKAINASFAESFWIQTEEEEAELIASGKISTEKHEFEARVRAFFGENGVFAQLYLDYFFGDNEPDYSLFPDEMLLYMIQNSNWMSLTIIPLEEIKEI